ncbi:MAG TPA: short chain dehydrogenase [Kofleriaceae bacterium]|nr:short chain dehydrogenase [Kofleriaceae bacterium]
MKIIVIGATGTIGATVAAALRPKHTVIPASRNGEHKVDIKNAESITRLLDAHRDADAVVVTAGGGAWKPLADLTDADFAASLADKLMGQVNVIRAALTRIRDNGVIVVTSGVLAQKPMPGSAAVSILNAGLEGFVRAAALEAPRNIRVNVVSPPWVTETLAAMKMPPQPGALPAATVAKAYVAAIEGTATGQTISPS